MIKTNNSLDFKIKDLGSNDVDLSFFEKLGKSTTNKDPSVIVFDPTKINPTIDHAKSLGKEAFHSGKKCIPYHDPKLMDLIKQQQNDSIKIFDAWLGAWHKENLDQSY